MSGHSKWSQIKHKKAAEDAKRSKYFSKLSAMITVAAREGGGDPEKNPKLRVAIDKAKEFNMPKDNIERAIKRGTGELEGVKLEEVIFEAYGPEGVGILIKTITDNKNRTANEIRSILNKHNMKMANSGSVSFQFKEKIVFRIPKESYSEELALSLIEAGVEDIKEEQEAVVLISSPQFFSQIKSFLEKRQIPVLESSFELVSAQEQEVSQEAKEALESLFEALDQQPEVEEIYSTLRS